LRVERREERGERREERELQEVAWRGRDEATIRFRNRPGV